MKLRHICSTNCDARQRQSIVMPPPRYLQCAAREPRETAQEQEQNGYPEGDVEHWSADAKEKTKHNDDECAWKAE